jgi:nitronate monooxygenase
MALPTALQERLGLPVIAAPMTGVSSLDLVLACCRLGVIGSFPTHVTANTDELDDWLTVLSRAADDDDVWAPVAPNLVVHRTNTRLDDDVSCLIRHRVELVITSVGSPKPVLGRLHDAGCAVLADVATMRHVERALDIGVHGLVLLAAGAGGQTGWNNPFAFVRAVRDVFDGPIVLAGGISDGTALLSAEILGADLAYMGTKFIATQESAASAAYKQAVAQASIDDVETTLLRTGLPANLLRSWLESAGLTAAGATSPEAGFDFANVLRARDEWSAGHSVHGVADIVSAAELLEPTRLEYEAAIRSFDTRRLLR